MRRKIIIKALIEIVCIKGNCNIVIAVRADYIESVYVFAFFFKFIENGIAGASESICIGVCRDLMSAFFKAYECRNYYHSRYKHEYYHRYENNCP